MPLTINPFPVLRTVALRPRPAVIRRGHVVVGVVGRRTFADKSKDVPEAEKGAVGPNMEQAEHVSEEAAKMAKIQGGQGPDIEGQGTPVQDILKEEKDTRKNAPQVLKDDVKAGNTTKPQTRPFSTYARRRLEVQSTAYDANPEVGQAFAATAAAAYNAYTQSVADVKPKGHKFPLPPAPLPRELVKDHSL
ncbi:hypothetical protein BST61_g8559 [Cercospora zeina]